MTTTETLKIRPYARLLTMLGEQLIKNERIALIELIKNSYDADSPWVKLSFIGFDDNFRYGPKSKIILEDNGCGMSREVIEKHWLNPATPEKKVRKLTAPTTRKGRVIQGDKGIGRFAVFKLGRQIRVITRAEGEMSEHVLDYNFSHYDDEFLWENGEKKDLFIDDLTVNLSVREPQCIKSGEIILGRQALVRLPQGTRIEISNLKGEWSGDKVKHAYRDISRLQPIFFSDDQSTEKPDIQEDSSGDSPHSIKERLKNDFSVWIYKDDRPQNYPEERKEKLNFLFHERAVLRIENGLFDDIKNEFRFNLNGELRVLGLSDPAISGLNVFWNRFGHGAKELQTRRVECGSFQFRFYVFDLTAKPPSKYSLDTEDKVLIRSHRIYLYRDGIRVYPYGEPEDDWLGIDTHRGTVSAAQFLSNDQVVGYVHITQEGNPRLRDKTSREGLIDEGNATDDFIALIRTVLRYIREHDYKRHILNQQTKSKHDVFRSGFVLEELKRLDELVKHDHKASHLLATVQKQYTIERQYLVQRAETTEDLAGVGLSVETASHDIMAIMGKAMVNIDSLIRDAIHGEFNKDELHKELQSLRGMLSFIEAQLKDIQLLFKSSKQRRRILRIREIVEKVERIYRRLVKNENIALSVEEVGPPLVAKTTDAVLLQLLLNLFDNSIFWLKQVSRREKRIQILLDGTKGQMIFSDNGPGVRSEDAPYIFEPFYSGKGEEGRGLGLYIARQLLDRHDYSIDLAELKSERILPGANFVVNFVSEER